MSDFIEAARLLQHISDNLKAASIGLYDYLEHARTFEDFTTNKTKYLQRLSVLDKVKLDADEYTYVNKIADLTALRVCLMESKALVSHTCLCTVL